MRVLKQILSFFVIGFIFFAIVLNIGETEAYVNPSDSQTKVVAFQIPFSFNDSCGNFKNMRFWSPDKFTGGFSSISFIFKKSGELFLIDSTAVMDKCADTGNVYHWECDTTAKGNWCIRDKSIICSFQKDKEFIKNTFCVPNKSNANRTTGSLIMGLSNIIVYPLETDTIIIRGIPCVTTNTR